MPKNFVQDTVVCAELLGQEVPMHKYAVQITVADPRDGGCSGSTLREACSWGKVEVTHEQMVYAEATSVLPAARQLRLPPGKLALPPAASMESSVRLNRYSV